MANKAARLNSVQLCICAGLERHTRASLFVPAGQLCLSAADKIMLGCALNVDIDVVTDLTTHLLPCRHDQEGPTRLLKVGLMMDHLDALVDAVAIALIGIEQVNSSRQSNDSPIALQGALVRLTHQK